MGLTMLVTASLTPLTSLFQPPTNLLASARISSWPSAAPLMILSVSASRSLIILTMLFRLILMTLYWPLYSVVMVGGMMPLATLST